jgi:hypothetical protein
MKFWLTFAIGSAAIIIGSVSAAMIAVWLLFGERVY